MTWKQLVSHARPKVASQHKCDYPDRLDRLAECDTMAHPDHLNRRPVMHFLALAALGLGVACLIAAYRAWRRQK
jgi:ferric-dicitrate binding protein FerR (iron transport regulator)